MSLNGAAAQVRAFLRELSPKISVPRLSQSEDPRSAVVGEAALPPPQAHGKYAGRVEQDREQGSQVVAEGHPEE